MIRFSFFTLLALLNQPPNPGEVSEEPVRALISIKEFWSHVSVSFERELAVASKDGKERVLEKSKGTVAVGDDYLHRYKQVVSKAELFDTAVDFRIQEQLLLQDGGVIGFSTQTGGKKWKSIAADPFQEFERRDSMTFGLYDPKGNEALAKSRPIVFTELFALPEMASNQDLVFLKESEERIRIGRRSLDLFFFKKADSESKIRLGLDVEGRLRAAEFEKIYKKPSGDMPYTPDPRSVVTHGSFLQVIFPEEEGFSYWVQSELRYESGKRYYLEKSKFEAVSKIMPREISLRGDYPDGTEVTLKGQPQIKAEWRDGKVVKVTYGNIIDRLSRARMFGVFPVRYLFFLLVAVGVMLVVRKLRQGK